MAGFAFLKPEEVVDAWDIRPGDKIADFGCGAGFFDVPLAKKAGSNGKVYAIDIRPEALEAVRTKSKLFHIQNLDAIRADLEAKNGSGLRSESIDKIIISNILFQVDNKTALAAEACRILKPGGSVIFIEWNETENAVGPSLDNRVGKDEAKKIFEESGLSVSKEFGAGSHHYGFVFKKQ